MTTKTLIIFCLLSYIAAQCSDGCLRCVTNLPAMSVCSVCDVANLYYLNSTNTSQCLQNTDKLCLQIDSNGNCTQCTPGNYFNQSLATPVCQAAVGPALVQNCNHYGFSQLCQDCMTGFFLQNNTCLPIDIQIANCAIQTFDNYCQQCNNYYYISVDRKTCNKLVALPNCLLPVNQTCNQCNTNTIIDTSYQGSYIFNYLISSDSKNQKQDLVLNQFNFPKINQNLGICRPTQVSNCLVFANYQTCLTCNSNYYLTFTGQCIPYPLTPIQFCKIYNTYNSCQICNANYDLSSINSTPITFICVPSTSTTQTQAPNCTTQQVIGSTIKCNTCSTSYYLNNNSCTARSTGSAYLNCITNSPTSDQCLTCNSTYVLSTASPPTCVTLISQCQTQSSSIVCTQCNATYVPSQNQSTCSLPNTPISQCSFYDSSIKCNKCNSQYYLTSSGTQCTPFPTTVNSCSSYFLDSPKCNYCNSKYISVFIKNTCTNANYQANCIAYNFAPATPVCIQCADTFQLSSGAVPTCVSILASLNCLQYDIGNSICTKCSPNYILYTWLVSSIKKSACVQTQEYIVANCDANSQTQSFIKQSYYNTNTLTNFNYTSNIGTAAFKFQPCTQCGDKSIPIKSDYACIKNPTSGNQMMITGDFTLVTNCILYNYGNAALDSGNYNIFKCQLCDLGYALNENNTCTSLIASFSNYPILAIDHKNNINAITNIQLVSSIQIAAGTYQTNFPSSQIISIDLNLSSGYSSSTALNTKYISVLCKPTNISLITFASVKYSNVNPALPTINTSYQIDDWSRITPELKCQTFTWASNFTMFIQNDEPSPQSLFQGICDYVRDFTLTDTIATTGVGIAISSSLIYECAKCQFGQGGAIKLSTQLRTRNALQLAFIDNCTTSLVNCKSSKNTIYGLNLYWKKLFSCYFCNDTFGIPVLIYQGKSKSDISFLNWNQYNFTSTAYTSLNITLPPNQICVNVSSSASIRSAFNISSSIRTVVPMRGCGLALFNTAYTSAQFDNTYFGQTTPIPFSSNTNAALVCAACSPGYSPVYITSSFTVDNNNLTNNSSPSATLSNLVVQKCSLIPNCNLTSNNNLLVNGCGQCNAGFAFGIIATTTNNITTYIIDRTQCVKLPVQNQNCLAYQLTCTGLNCSGLCRQCNRGFKLTSQGFCDQLTILGCDTFTVVNGTVTNTYPNYFDRTTNAFSEDFNSYQYQFGTTQCSKCSTGYSLFSTAATFNFQCALSSLSSTLSTTTNINPMITTDNLNLYQQITQCLQYQYIITGSMTVNTNDVAITPASSQTVVGVSPVTNALQCVKCASGYVLGNNNSVCYSNQLLQNCLVATQYNDCLTCQPTFGRVKSTINTSINICLPVAMISNCQTINSSQSGSNLVCQQCSSKFYFNTSTNQCTSGNIQNCIVYNNNNPNICITCDTGYTTFATLDSIQSVVCIQVPSTLSSTCTTITSGIVADSTTTTLQLNCTQCNNTTPTLTTLTGIINMENECKAFDPILNCSIYNFNSAPFTSSGTSTFMQCQQCNTNYYFKAASYQCLDRVISLSNCSTPSINSDTCQTCNVGYYLDSNLSCLLNPIGVLGCLTYTASATGVITCTSCNSTTSQGMYLTALGLCSNVLTSVTGCINYDKNQLCLNCSSGFYLQTTAATSSSAASVSCITGITQCATQTNQNTCTACNSGYFLNSTASPNTCNSYTTSTTRCSIQSLNSDACQTCNPNYYFATATKTCTQILQANFIPGCQLYASLTNCS